MKIAQQTESVMVLKQGLAGAVIGGALAMIMGILFMFASSASFRFQGSGFWIPLIFVIIGFLIILFSHRTTITIDKNQKKITVAKKGMIVGTSNEYALDNVGAVQITEEYRTEETRMGNTVTRTPKRYELVSLIMKDGSNLALRDEMAGSMSNFTGTTIHKDRQQVFGEAIASFIGVPCNRVVPGLSNPISSNGI